MPTSTLSSELLSVDQAAVKLGVCPWTVRQLIKQGKLRALRPSPRRIRFREADLEAYLSSTASVPYC